MATSKDYHTQEFKLSSPDNNVETEPVHEVTLPCYLSPKISAATMEIRWFKWTDCIYQYKNGQVTEGRGHKGRVSLIMEELQRGNVSLTLRDVRRMDSGLYRCEIVHGKCVQDTLVSLNVKAVVGFKPPLRKKNSMDNMHPYLGGENLSEDSLNRLREIEMAFQKKKRTIQIHGNRSGKMTVTPEKMGETREPTKIKKSQTPHSAVKQTSQEKGASEPENLGLRQKTVSEEMEKIEEVQSLKLGKDVREGVEGAYFMEIPDVNTLTLDDLDVEMNRKLGLMDREIERIAQDRERVNIQRRLLSIQESSGDADESQEKRDRDISRLRERLMTVDTTLERMEEEMLFIRMRRLRKILVQNIERMKESAETGTEEMSRHFISLRYRVMVLAEEIWRMKRWMYPVTESGDEGGQEQEPLYDRTLNDRLKNLEMEIETLGEEMNLEGFKELRNPVPLRAEK